jgi:hypothetical protein
MGAIERHIELLHYGNMVSAWVGFSTALEEKINNYANAHKRSAEITQRTPTSIVLRCQVVNVPEDIFAVRTVSISAHFINSMLVISCTIQSWRKVPSGQSPLISSESLEFEIDDDRLRLGQTNLTPVQAADKVAEALLR